MIFSGTTFIFYFLPLLLILYYILPEKFQNTILIIFSLFFYIYGDVKFLPLLLITGIVNYFLSRKIRNKSVLIVGIILNILPLLYFKYTNFIIDIINSITSFNIDLFDLILPLGISFTTFRMISFLIDAYNNKIKDITFKKVILYTFLFTYQIEGPIVRYADIEDELDKRIITSSDKEIGTKRFIIGLSKKVILADTLALFITSVSGYNTVLSLWMVALLNILRLYLDFSAYSDMSIGLARMLGFHFKENFNYPFINNGMSDFWRKWHISLTSWFKDYIYIPLGGNRCSNLRNIINILIVWLLTGLWHGASYTFIIWGLFFGIILILEKFIFKNFVNKHQIISCIITDILAIIGFVFFYAKDLPSAFLTIKGMLGLNNLLLINSEVIFYIKNYILILIISIAVSLNIFKIFKGKLQNIAFIYYLALLILSTAYIVDSSFNPFLYFRFWGDYEK